MINRQSFTIEGAEGKAILMDLHFKSGQEAHPLVLFVHGFKGFKDWGAYNLVAEYFVKQGFRFLKFNFSHNGTSPENPTEFTDLGAFGDNTFSKEFFDLNQVISFAKSGKNFPKAEILNLIGHSRGGGTSIIHSAKDPRINKLITWAAISDFRSLWKKEDEKEWRIKGVIFNFNTRTKQYTPLKIDLLYDLEKHSKSYDILLAAQQIRNPWLIIHGDQDVNVSLNEALKLKENCLDAELFIVPHANHVFGASHPFTKDELPLELHLACEKSVDFLKN
ncbi:alpha/beta hydrolase family protein [Daejeonella sp.]|jgi:pimeloyl-ACP methyl ester carboxylesterase|uniref:alpha/beta hydrolase family protein n=1 Tax=Daejeonella sp. TaxID=2805397 RepID=UPI003784A0D2